MSVSNLLVGKRAVYTQIERQWNGKEHVEVSRKMFRGTIAALVVSGSDRCTRVVMLYDDGSLREYSLETITVEGDGATPYRE